jgi:hypothetical protein
VSASGGAAIGHGRPTWHAVVVVCDQVVLGAATESREGDTRAIEAAFEVVVKSRAGDIIKAFPVMP